MSSAWVPQGNDQTRLTSDLRSCILQLRAATDGLLKHKNIMAQMLNGGVDYTPIETYYSVPTGQGQTVHDVVGTASDQLQLTQVQGLIQRFG